MTIEDAVNLLTKKHLDNRAKEWIRDPVAYTLYEVWKIADSKVTYHPSESVTTNADRIRAMSDEELAVWVVGIHPEDCPFGPYDYGCIRTDCDGCWLDWLRSPAEV